MTEVPDRPSGSSNPLRPQNPGRIPPWIVAIIGAGAGYLVGDLVGGIVGLVVVLFLWVVR